MTRAWFCRGSEDFNVAGPIAPGDPYRPAAAVWTFWDAETGGNRYTDLLLAGTTPVDSITVPHTGQPPAFQGPDGVVAMWVQAGESTSRRMIDAGADIAVQAAADREAVAADRAAVEAVGTTNDTIIAGRINDPASATAGALSTSYDGAWQPSTAYVAGDLFTAPDGTMRMVTADHTSGATYNTANSSAAVDPVAVATRKATSGPMLWTTGHEVIARTLGWHIVTDQRYAGGADPTGSTDASAAWQAAHDALPASGGTVWGPAGSYKMSTAATLTKPCTILGEGPRTKFKTSSATANILTVSAGQVTIGHVDFSSTVTRTDGWYVDILSAASNARVEHFTMAGTIGGIRTAATSAVIRRGSIRDGIAGTGVAVRVDGGFAVTVEDITTDAAAQTYAGILVTNVGDLIIKNCQLIHAGTGLLVQPGAGQSVTSLWAEHSFFDNCTTGVSLNAAGGTIARSRFASCWMSSATTWGVRLVTSGGGTIDGTDFANCHIFLNGSGGVQLSDAGVKNTRINGGAICANAGNAGVLVSDAVTGLSIQGAKLGDGYGLGGNGYGVFFQAAATTGATNVQITGNDLTGNTVSAIAGAPALRDDIIIKDNLGFASKSATAAITVTASPFTYTAGKHFETVYINGGTVSLVKVEGLSAFTSTGCSVRLGPGKSVEVTYTAAPNMVATKGG